MYDHLLRRAKRRVYQPLATRTPISPNMITGLGFMAGLLAALLAALGLFKAGLACWLVNRFLDGLDGEVARAKHSQSDLGGYLDILADLFIYALLPTALALYHQTSRTWFATVFMLASFYLNVGSWMYLSSLLEKRGQGAAQSGEVTSVSMPRGLVEGGETVLFFTLFFALPKLSWLLFLLFGALTFVTAAGRVKWAVRHLEGET
ncbi:MAG TPA: CDP-alcohol phosphatidyltransferase family protein [Phycisphaerales bacterium]|nr:CDP-alcohol phosphatidyltransferase family protein [Phycisphaerales bacterium]